MTQGLHFQAFCLSTHAPGLLSRPFAAPSGVAFPSPWFGTTETTKLMQLVAHRLQLHQFLVVLTAPRDAATAVQRPMLSVEAAARGQDLR